MVIAPSAGKEQHTVAMASSNTAAATGAYVVAMTPKDYLRAFAPPTISLRVKATPTAVTTKPTT
jgi:hypothetical protein